MTRDEFVNEVCELAYSKKWDQSGHKSDEREEVVLTKQGKRIYIGLEGMYTYVKYDVGKNWYCMETELERNNDYRWILDAVSSILNGEWKHG